MQDETIIKKVKQVTLIVSGVYTLLGIMLLLFPTQINDVFGYALGGIAVAFGVYRLMLYFMRNRAVQLLAIDLYAGIILGMTGIFCLVNHRQTLEYLSVIFGIFLIAGSIIKIQNALDLKHLGLIHWWAVLVLGLVSLVMAMLLILPPIWFLKIQLLATGLFLLYDGISGLVTVILFAVSRRNAGKEENLQSGGAAEAVPEGLPPEPVDETAADEEAAEEEETYHFDPEMGEPLH